MMINDDNKPVALADAALDDANGGILIGLLLPAVRTAPEPTEAMKQSNNLRQLGTAGV